MEVLLAGTTVRVSDPSAVPDRLRPRTHVVCDVFVIEPGVAATLALPPAMDSAKSAATRSPEPLASG